MRSFKSFHRAGMFAATEAAVMTTQAINLVTQNNEDMVLFLSSLFPLILAFPVLTVSIGAMIHTGPVPPAPECCTSRCPKFLIDNPWHLGNLFIQTVSAGIILTKLKEGSLQNTDYASFAFIGCTMVLSVLSIVRDNQVRRNNVLRLGNDTARSQVGAGGSVPGGSTADGGAATSTALAVDTAAANAAADATLTPGAAIAAVDLEAPPAADAATFGGDLGYAAAPGAINAGSPEEAAALAAKLSAGETVAAPASSSAPAPGFGLSP